MDDDALTPLLEPGERLLWAGRPPQGVRFGAADVVRVPFSLVWLGVALTFEAMAVRSMVVEGGLVPKLFAAVGLIFVLAGVQLAFGRFLDDARERARIRWGVSDRRVFVLRDGALVWSKGLAELGDVAVDEGRSGVGTLYLGAVGESWLARLDARMKGVVPIWDGVVGVREVARGRVGARLGAGAR